MANPYDNEQFNDYVNRMFPETPTPEWILDEAYNDAGDLIRTERYNWRRDPSVYHLRGITRGAAPIPDVLTQIETQRYPVVRRRRRRRRMNW